MSADGDLRPFLGYGLGLRPEHYEEIRAAWPQL